MNNCNLAIYLDNFVKLFPMLRELDISNCRINFEFSNSIQQSEYEDKSIQNFIKNLKSILCNSKNIILII